MFEMKVVIVFHEITVKLPNQLGKAVIIDHLFNYHQIINFNWQVSNTPQV